MYNVRHIIIHIIYVGIYTCTGGGGPEDDEEAEEEEERPQPAHDKRTCGECRRPTARIVNASQHARVLYRARTHTFVCNTAVAGARACAHLCGTNNIIQVSDDERASREQRTDARGERPQTHQLTEINDMCYV